MPASQAATTPEQLAGQIREALVTLADPALAVPMRAYMRDRFPFLGIQTPVRPAALRPLLKVNFDQKWLLTAADLLYSLPEREYRYAAIDLLARHVGRLDMSAIAPLLALAQRDPWWDIRRPGWLAGWGRHRCRRRCVRVPRLHTEPGRRAGR